MTVPVAEWLDILEREYLIGFVTAGGAAVKFVVGGDNQLAFVQRQLRELSRKHNLIFIPIDAGDTRLHMIQDVFFAAARALDWNALAQHRIEALFKRNDYAWPESGCPMPMAELATANRIDITLLRRDVRQWLTEDILRDNQMTQDFRVAMTQLCLLQMETPSDGAAIEAPIIEWLTGRLRAISALKSAPITAKITRYNGRAMLRSLCRWLHKNGKHGLCLALDIRQLGRTGKSTAGHFHYSPGSVMDGFEVLRQLIDESEYFTGMQLVVLADGSLTGDDRNRSLNAYLALKMRIWSDVRAEGRDDPLAPLVQFAAAPLGAPAAADSPP